MRSVLLLNYSEFTYIDKMEKQKQNKNITLSKHFQNKI